MGRNISNVKLWSRTSNFDEVPQISYWKCTLGHIQISTSLCIQQPNYFYDPNTDKEPWFFWHLWHCILKNPLYPHLHQELAFATIAPQSPQLCPEEKIPQDDSEIIEPLLQVVRTSGSVVCGVRAWRQFQCSWSFLKWMRKRLNQQATFAILMHGGGWMYRQSDVPWGTSGTGSLATFAPSPNSLRLTCRSGPGPTPVFLHTSVVLKPIVVAPPVMSALL